MKSKKWLISVVLAVLLVAAFELPDCEAKKKSGWYTPEGEHISFKVTTMGGEYGDIGRVVVNSLKEFGLDVTHEVLDSTTFRQYFFDPSLGKVQAGVYRNSPFVDPWSDWIWALVAEPEGMGKVWNPAWHDNPVFNKLVHANNSAANRTKKKKILYEMQEIVNEDLPLIYLVRPAYLSAWRNDKWKNWHNQMGGIGSWTNEFGIREMTPIKKATRITLGTTSIPANSHAGDNAITRTDTGCLYVMLVYENLAAYPKIDPDSLKLNPDAPYKFHPKLAANYTVSYEDDGKGGQNQIWTIALQPDAKWHDGVEFTADDVVYTLKYVLNRHSSGRPVDWNAVESDDPEKKKILPKHILAEAVGKKTVKFTYVEGKHLPEGWPANWWLWDPIVPKHIFEPDKRDPSEWDGNGIGTGPYKLKKWAADDYLALERVEDYWGELPAAEEVVFTFFADLGTMVSALQTGAIDATVSSSIPHMLISDLEDNPNITVDPVEGALIWYLALNMHPTEGYKPLSDKVFRQALAYAIDGDYIAEIVFGKHGTAVDGFIYVESGMYHPDLEPYDVNLKKARDMLLTAGYTYVE